MCIRDSCISRPMLCMQEYKCRCATVHCIGCDLCHWNSAESNLLSAELTSSLRNCTTGNLFQCLHLHTVKFSFNQMIPFSGSVSWEILWVLSGRHWWDWVTPEPWSHQLDLKSVLIDSCRDLNHRSTTTNTHKIFHSINPCTHYV